MTQQQLKKYLLPLFFGSLVLSAGIVAGYCIGLTTLGKFLPGLFAVGTVVSFMIAVYNAFRQPTIKNNFANESTFFLFCLFISAMSLGSSISAPAMWQSLSSDRVAGFLPYSDASCYYQQLLAWPAQSFDAWNSRRPINAVLNILEFHLGGSTLLGMILVRIALSALAITLFIVALSFVVGQFAALTAGFVLLFWTWPYASSMQSEVNGITIACAGYALLLIALQQRRRLLAYSGLIALVLAYLFRPYNPLMPAFFAFFVMVSIVENWRKGFQSALILSVAVTALSFVIPKVLYLAYGNANGEINGNTGDVVLGLARGTNWKEASEFVKIQHPGLSEKNKNALEYELARKLINEDKKPLIRNLIKNSFLSLYVFQTEYTSAWGIPKIIVLGDNGARTIVRFLVAMFSRIEIWLGLVISGSSIILISYTRCIPSLKSINSGKGAFVMFIVSLVTFATIAPFIFCDAGWRVVATLYPGLAILATGIPIGIQYLRFQQKIKHNELCVEQESTIKSPSQVTYVSFALIIIVLIAMPYPLMSRFFLGTDVPLTEAMILDVREGAKPQWTGFNRAVITKSDLLAWSKREGTDLAPFLMQYGMLIRKVRFEHGKYVLVCKYSKGIQDFTTNSMFKIQVEPKGRL